MSEFGPVDEGKARRPTIPRDLLGMVGAALFEHGATLGSVGNWVANARENFEELHRLFRTSDQLQAGFRYLYQSHGSNLPQLFVQQCPTVSHRFEGAGRTIVSLSAYGTSAYLPNKVVQELNQDGLDTVRLSYHGQTRNVSQLMARTYEQELLEVRDAGYAAVKRILGPDNKLYASFPVGMGFSAGALKMLAVTLNAAEAKQPLPYGGGLILTSMPPILTNQSLGPLLDGAYRAFKLARATGNPNYDFLMPIDLAKVFADNPPWPRWLGTLDFAPLGSLITVRRMQELIDEKIHLLPKNFRIFIIHSDNDELCDQQAALDFYNKIPSEHKTFLPIAGPHLPLVSEPMEKRKNKPPITPADAAMHRQVAHNILLDCAIELATTF